MICLTCVYSTYFLILFNQSELKGNALETFLVFSAAEALGTMAAPFTTKLVSKKFGIVFTCFAISTLGWTIKNIEMTENHTHMQVLAQAFLMGMNFNYIILINNEIIPFKHRFIGFNINFSVALTLSMFTPIIAIQPEPFPTVAVFVIFTVQMLTALTINFETSSPDDSFASSTTRNAISP